MLRGSILRFWLFFIFFLSSFFSVQAESWKTYSESSSVLISSLAGLGFVGSRAGPSFLFNGSYQFLPEGLIPGIADAFSLETGLGFCLPVHPPAFYALHLRWDFEKDGDWTFYAVGGMGGAPSASVLSFAPHFGVGGFWKGLKIPQVRFEFSSRMLGAGVGFPL